MFVKDEPNNNRDRQLEVLRCADPNGGFRHWLQRWARIEVPGGAGAFEMWPCHLEAIEALEKERYIIVLKARQIGMSWLFGAAYPLWLAMFHPSTLCLLFSQREEEAAELVRKCRFIWSRLPVWMRPDLEKDNSLELVFKGIESRIIAFSGSPTAGSGYTARYAFADEHAKQTYAEQQFAAIRPTIDMGGQFVSNSTAFGTGNFFHQLWQAAQRGENGFHSIFFPYNVRPGRDPEWWASMRDSWPNEVQFFQEYPRDADEAFQSSVQRPINAAYLRIGASKIEPILMTDNTDLQPIMRLKPRRGELGFRLYQEPKPGKNYVIGADVSEGFVDGDAQAAIVLDRSNGEEVAALHGRWPIHEYAEHLDHLAQAYNALVGIERNNHGHAMIVRVQALMAERMRTANRPRYTLYHEKPILNALGSEVRPQRPGWPVNARTKPMMLSELEAAFKDADVLVASSLILNELKSLVIDDKGAIGAEKPYHDDLAMALAIANQMINKTDTPRDRPRIAVAMGQHTKELLANQPEAARVKPLLERVGLVLPKAQRSKKRPIRQPMLSMLDNRSRAVTPLASW